MHFYRIVAMIGDDGLVAAKPKVFKLTNIWSGFDDKLKQPFIKLDDSDVKLYCPNIQFIGTGLMIDGFQIVFNTKVQHDIRMVQTWLAFAREIDYEAIGGKGQYEAKA